MGKEYVMRNGVAALVAAIALHASDAPAEPNAPALQQRHDPARARSWSLIRDGVLVHDALSGRKTRLELPGWLWLEWPHCAPDLVLGPGGEAVVTSNVVPTLWRIDARTLVVSVHSLALDADRDKDVGFAAIVYSPDEGAYLAYSDMLRTVWKIDIALKTGTKVRGAARAPHTLGARCADRQ
jgi:hypothetical protein